MSIYGFRSGPTFRTATPDEMFMAAMDQPMSIGATFFDQAKGGILESFGLGTAIRDFAIPEGEETTGDMVESGLRLLNPLTSSYEGARRVVQSLRRDSPTLSQDAYKSSPYFRENIPWDEGMTEDRAAALAMWDDAKRVREHYASKRPITAFIGNLSGQAFDPINYIPVAGPAVKAAAVARVGKVAGTALASSLDAAGNTALFGLATRDRRASYGDDVSWQTTVSEIATAALIGGAFGSLAGAMGARTDARTRREAAERLSTLKTTQEARIALNEGIDALVRGEDVSLSPNATEPLARIQQEIIAYHGSPHDFDAFSLEKLGSGEGAQAYGRGLYFAENERVARSYRAALSDHPFPDGDPRNIAYTLLNMRGEAKARDLLSNTHSAEEVDNLIAAAREATEKGNLYEVGIKADLEQFLDWDKPLEEQPQAVQEIMTAHGYSAPSKDLPAKARTIGATVARELQKPDEIARLRAAGIPGIRYLDYGSRGAGEGTRNFVLFDDQIIRIRSKNGVPVDASTAAPEPTPEGRAQAEASIAKPDDYKALAAQYQVDPETGSFIEDAEIAQLGVEGRLTEGDVAVLADAQATLEDGAAYGEALKSVANCLI